MGRARVTLTDSNNEAFPVGSWVWGQEEQGLLTQLAGYDVENIAYFGFAQRVDVRTALGYHFSISTDDYEQLVAE